MAETGNNGAVELAELVGVSDFSISGGKTMCRSAIKGRGGN